MVFEIWQSLKDGIFQYSIDAWESMDPWFMPFVFLGVIGFLYAGMQSITIAVIGILITFGIFGATTSIFENVPEISQLLYVITIIGITLLIVTFAIRRGRPN